MASTGITNSMSQPIIFRHCLLILSHESRYLQGKVDDQEVPMLMKSFTSNFVESTLLDQVSVTKHIISALLRVLTRTTSANECKILNEKHLMAALACLDGVLAAMTSKSEALEKLLLDAAALFELLKKILYLLTGVMEATKLHLSNKLSGTLADYEEIAERSISILTNIVCYFSSCSLGRMLLPVEDARQWDKFDTEYIPNHQSKSELASAGNNPVDVKVVLLVKSVLRGPLLAQLVAGLLYFAQHNSKTISLQALQCLLGIQRFANDITDWRMYVPGAFTALFRLCTAGYKR